MDTDKAALKLVECITNSFSGLEGNEAIAFSGGIDSTLLMHLSNHNLHAYTVGIKGSMDIDNAVYVSGNLGFDIKKVEINEEIVLEALKSLKKLDPSITKVEAGYESVLYISLLNAEEQKVITGQGSDELFYGYRKYIDGIESNSEDIKKLQNRTLPRETKIAAFLGKELVTPYLSPCVMDLSARLRREDCIFNGINKMVVRKAAVMSGLPEEIAFRPKKAAQYGSGIQKIIRGIDFDSL